MATGEVLYYMYAKFMADESCEIDNWDEIEEIDRKAWNRLAEWHEQAVRS